MKNATKYIGIAIIIISSFSTIKLLAQFEINIDKSVGDLDLGLNGTPYMELRSPKELLGDRGASITMYKNDFLQRTETVHLDAGTYDNYGSLSLTAYVGELPLFNNLNNGIPAPPHPYSMIRLTRKNISSGQSNNTFSWNFGVHDEILFDDRLPLTSSSSCEDCLTLAYETGGLAANYVYAFDSDGSISTASDSRLKHNFSNVATALEGILKLDPKKYNYKWIEKNPSRKSIGFLAQDVQKIFPDLVSSIRQPNGEKTLMLNYIGMIPYITRAMQEQQDIIDSQKEVINNLQIQMNLLRTEIEEIKKTIIE